MAYLITNGTVVNADFSYKADVFLDDGVIKEIGKDLKVPDTVTIIDAEGKLLLPGGIDVSTKLNYPNSADSYFTGTQAALAGGTTLILNLVESGPSKMMEAYEDALTLAASQCCCNFAFKFKIDGLSYNADEKIILLTKKGINAFHLSENLNDACLLKLFSLCKKVGVLPIIHAENNEIIKYNEKKFLESGITGPEGHLYSRPEMGEEAAAYRAIALAETCKSPLFIANVSSKSVGKVIAKKRAEGCQVFGQPILAALVFDGTSYFLKDWNRAAGCVVSPPLHTDKDTPTHLLKMLSSGVLQTTGSNHCTFNIAQKAVGDKDFSKIPHGINGIQERMSVLWQKAVIPGIIDENTFVAVTSSNAAKILNIYPRKGHIAIFSDADLIIWNPKGSSRISAETVKQAGDFNAFEGLDIVGVPEYVFCNGKLVVEKQNLHTSKGDGQFVPLAPFAPHVFSRLMIENIPETVNRPVFKGDLTQGKDEKIEKKEAPKDFYARPPTRAGGRSLHDSTFNLAGKQVDENEGRTSGVKLSKPSGPSTQFW